MPSPPNTETPPAEYKVFIAEDSLPMQAALKDLLEELTSARIVGTATSEATAIDWAKSNAGNWNVAIVDLMLMEGDGFSLVRRLKQISETGRIVVFSAYVTEVIQRHCIAIGADAVFSKTQSRQLAEYVERAAGQGASPA